MTMWSERIRLPHSRALTCRLCTQITKRFELVLSSGRQGRAWLRWPRGPAGPVRARHRQMADWQFEVGPCRLGVSEDWSMTCLTSKLCTQIAARFKMVLWWPGADLAAATALRGRHRRMPDWQLEVVPGCWKIVEMVTDVRKLKLSLLKKFYRKWNFLRSWI